MYIRNHKGKIIFIKDNQYVSKKELYSKIWKLKYNIDITKQHKSNKSTEKQDRINEIFGYIDGEKYLI